jgi:hypothetical protein
MPQRVVEVALLEGDAAGHVTVVRLHADIENPLHIVCIGNPVGMA